MAEVVDPEDLVDGITTVPVPDDRLVGYVIGRQGRTITKLMRETSTYIHHQKETNEFIIEGEQANRYSAKLKVKEIISNGLKTQKENFQKCWRFPAIDSNGQGFVLEPIPLDNSAFKVVLKDSINKDSSQILPDYSSFSSQLTNVLQSIYNERKDDVINNIWSHFGHIYLLNVAPEEKCKEFDAQELLNHVKWDNASNATRWRTKFVGGINYGIESHNLEEWMSVCHEKNPPFIRYEFVYLTPSCRVIRVKIFLRIDVTTNPPIYKNIPKCEPVANMIKSSDSYPYFYICGSTVKRAMVDAFQPAEGLDCRFIVDSGKTSQEQNADEEVDILFNFLRENMNIIRNVGLELPQENLPRDFDPYYARISERRTYPFTSEDDEQFTVKLSYEHTVNRPTSTSETTVDIHLQYDEWDKMLEDGTWNPQKIVDKIPQFMKCASSLAKILKVQERIPEEILARGPKAQAAYEKALKNGKAKYRRVPVVFIGQSRAGKTSLLKSLKREKFNPEEDSTDGVRLHRSLSLAEQDVWHEDVPIEKSFVNCTAKFVAENLAVPIAIDIQQRAAEGDFQVEPLDQDPGDVEKVAEPNYEMSFVEENGNSKFHEKKEIVAERQESMAEGANEQPSASSAPSLSHASSFESPIPEEVSEKAISILQNPEETEKDGCIHLVTFDFAGQPVYNATHPVFLPKKAIYILVHSLENDLHAKATPIAKHGSLERRIDDHCPMTNRDYLEFWLSFVASLWTTEGLSIIGDTTLELLRGGDAAPKKSFSTPKGTKLPKRMPPVFLVCTHADKPLPCDNKDAVETTREIFASLKRDTSGGEHLVRGIYTVNNTVSGGEGEEDKSVKDLRTHVYQVASSLPHLNEIVPIRWLQFEKELSNLATTENKKHLSLEEAKSVAMQCQIDTKTDEFNTVLNYFHDLKVIIYFEDTNLVIIDIQWLLDRLVQVITVKFVEDWEDEFENSWEKLENQGILEQALIDHIWEDETTASSLLRIMEMFSLLCRWRKLNDPDTFLVPSMLMNMDVEAVKASLSDHKTSRTLVVRFKSAHLPLGIFPRLLVIFAKTCNEKWPDSPQPNFYHNFCRFYDVGGETGKSFDLVVTSDMKTVSFSVINEQGIMGLPIKQLCGFLVEFLSSQLKAMRSNFPWMKNIEFEFCIRCPKCYSPTKPCRHHKVSGCTRDACLHFITEGELRNKQPRCYRDDTSKNTFFEEDFYCDWFDTATDKEKNDTNIVVRAVQLLALADRPSSSEGFEKETLLAGKISQSHEVVPYSTPGQDVSLPESSAMSIAQFMDLIEELKPYKSIINDPPAETVRECRNVCRLLKGPQRAKYIEKLREYVPSGTTGPREEENKLYQEMNVEKKQKLTQALCGADVWKRIAEGLGESSSSFEYFDRFPNPVEKLFEEACKKRRFTYGDLYDMLVSCKANGIADMHL